MEAIELRDNYIAFAMSILTGWNPDQCFYYLETLRRPSSSLIITEDDVLNMVRLRENGMMYKEIGELYGLSDQAVYYRIKRFKQRKFSKVG